jgi:hypothetical protein
VAERRILRLRSDLEPLARERDRFVEQTALVEQLLGEVEIPFGKARSARPHDIPPDQRHGRQQVLDHESGGGVQEVSGRRAHRDQAVDRPVDDAGLVGDLEDDWQRK